MLRRKFTIVDIKPNKFLANASVFVFKLEPGLMAAVRKYKEERKNKKQIRRFKEAHYGHFSRRTVPYEL